MKKTNKELEQEVSKLKNQLAKKEKESLIKAKESLDRASEHINKVPVDMPVPYTDMDSIINTFSDRLQTLKSEIGRTYSFTCKMKPMSLDEPKSAVPEAGYVNEVINKLCEIGDLTSALNKINNHLETIA